MLQMIDDRGTGPGAVVINRADYIAPAYWIDTVDLCFDLDPVKTRVLNKMTLRRNPEVAAQALKLDGEELNLARVLVNGQGTSFKMEGHSLVLENLPSGAEPFELEIFTTTCPSNGPGGTGALSILLNVLSRARPGGKIWISDPSWPNHWPMAELVGLKPQYYPYFDAESRSVDFPAMLKTLDSLGPNDIVLLHACCHNPTGANLTDAQWDQVAASLKKTGAFPLLDLAYLGFGNGIEEDAYGVRKVVTTVPESMIAFSGSKNFGLYRERAGVAIAIAKDAASADIVSSQMQNVIRATISQPPDHGAEIIRVILEDKELRAEWKAELEQMRTRMIRLRKKLVDAIRERSNSTDYDFIAEHRGMFSLLGLPHDVVEKLKLEDGVYMINDSRINVAGIPEDRVGELADALLAAVKSAGN